MSELTKTMTELQQKKIIHVARYRKSERTGLDVPLYSLSAPRGGIFDIHGLVAGVTSERLVEYAFVAKSLVPSIKKASVLDIGAAGSGLVQAISEYKKKWLVLGIDLAPGADAVMDVRSTGFKNRVFDQVISISTIEHVGLDIGDKNGDAKAMQEIFRILKKGGSAIVTVPYGKGNKPEYRVYDSRSLTGLTSLFKVLRREFYRYNSGKWVKCSQEAAERADAPIPLHFHSTACVCLLLRKQ